MRDAHLILTGDPEINWGYFQNWSLAKLGEEGFSSLIMWNVRLENGRLELDVEPGEYRLLTANRLPAGNIFAKRFDFSVEHGGCREIMLEMREASLADMLDRHGIPDYELKAASGEMRSIGELTGAGKRRIL